MAKAVLIGNGWAFVHIPKCGGTALRRVLTGKEIKGDLPLGDASPIRSPWHRLPKQRPVGLVFTVVRHPADWLASFWADQVDNETYLHRYWSVDPDQFAANVEAAHPGYVGRLYRAYHRWSGMRTFRLEDGLDEMLEVLGLGGSVPRTNASDRPVLRPETVTMIEDSEAAAMKAYGYARPSCR